MSLRSSRTLGRAVGLSTAAAACFSPAAATAQSRAGVSVSTGATASSNPYLLSGSNTDAIGANITVDPFVYFEDEDAAVTLSGGFTLEQFSKNYGTDASARVGAKGVFRLDERTTFKADAGYRTSRSAARRYFSGPDLENLDPGQFPDNSIVDPTLGNAPGRTTRLDVNASVERQTGPNSVLTASTGLGLTQVESGSGVDYKDASFAVGYSKQIAPTTSLRTTVDAGYVDYLGRRTGDGFFGTAMVGVDRQVSQSVNLSARLGVSVSDTASPLGGRRSTLSWAGEFNLCNTFPRGTLCATASRSAQPTSLSGLTNVTSAGLSYTHSLGTMATISLNGQYAQTSRSKQAGFALSNGKSRLANASLTYRRRLGERLSAFVTPSYTSIDDDMSDRRNNYQVMLGISYRFGSVQ